jgi:hypothetical protein
MLYSIRVCIFFFCLSIVHDTSHDFSLSVYQLIRFLVNFLNFAIHINFFDYNALVYRVMRSVRVIIDIKALELIYMLSFFRRWGSEYILWRRRCLCWCLNAKLAFSISMACCRRCKLWSGRDGWPVFCIHDKAVTMIFVNGLSSDGCL